MSADDGGGVEAQNFSPSSQMLLECLSSGDAPDVVSFPSRTGVDAPEPCFPGLMVDSECKLVTSFRSSIVQPSSQSSKTSPTNRRPSASSSSTVTSSSMLSSHDSSLGSWTPSSRPRRRYRRSPRPDFCLFASAASEFIRRSAAIEERSGRGGDPRGPRGDGASLGTSAKLIVRELLGSSACDGRGEHGITGLGSCIGDDVGDRFGDGEGDE